MEVRNISEHMEIDELANLENLNIRGGLKNLANGIKNGLGKVGQALSNVGQSVAWAPVMPFKGIMVRALNKRGVTNISKNDEISKVAQTFYNVIIKKQKNYETLENLDPVTIGLIVKAIIGFISAINDKKKSGQRLSEGESDFLEGAENAADTITNELQKTGSVSGETLINAGKQVLGGVLGGTKTVVDSSRSQTSQTPSQTKAEAAPENWFQKNKGLLIGVAAVVLILIIAKRKK